ncbi:MAG: uroporphyrinogen decarboxylase family protein, partial [Pseudomonadota bacterium]
PPASMDPTDSELEVVRHVVRELGKTHFLFAAPQIGHPQFGYSDASVSEVETWVRLFEDPDRHRQNLLNWVNHPNVRRGIEIGKREGLDGIAYGCDYGCNTGPFMSPELFRHAILPGLAAFCSLVHEHGMVMLHHACGNNQVLMDMIVEAGVDVYQSIQPEMDIKTLKKRYGKRITLWGGFPSGDLILSNPAQVRQLAAEQIQALKPDGGFIFGTSHSIMPAAKYENYAAILDALAEHGGYRH